MNFSIGITKCKHTNTILINNHAFDQTTSDDDHEETKKSGESSRFNTILETDPYNDRNAIDYNLCDFDGITEDKGMDNLAKTKKISPLNTDKEATSSRYISNMLQTAKYRGKQREIILDKQKILEQNIGLSEDDNTPRFISNSYKQKLSQRESFEAELRNQDERDEANDVRKVGFNQSFYGHVLNKGLGLSSTSITDDNIEKANLWEMNNNFSSLKYRNNLSSSASSPSAMINPHTVRTVGNDRANLMENEFTDSIDVIPSDKNDDERREDHVKKRKEMIEEARQRYFARKALRSKETNEEMK